MQKVMDKLVTPKEKKDAKKIKKNEKGLFKNEP